MKHSALPLALSLGVKMVSPPRYQTAAIVDGVLVFVFLPLSSRKDNSF